MGGCCKFLNMIFTSRREFLIHFRNELFRIKRSPVRMAASPSPCVVLPRWMGDLRELKMRSAFHSQYSNICRSHQVNFDKWHVMGFRTLLVKMREKRSSHWMEYNYSTVAETALCFAWQSNYFSSGPSFYCFWNCDGPLWTSTTHDAEEVREINSGFSFLLFFS